MSFEVEIKFRMGHLGHTNLIRELKEMGARDGGKSIQIDAYLSHPARDFAQTNEALRIRRIGDENRITYKGPRRPGPAKTREEIEVALAEGEDAYGRILLLFTNLGFQPVAAIRKTRRSYHLTYQGREVEVSLDVADDLGDFTEVEVIAASEADLRPAQTAVVELAHELGLTEIEPRSYLRMFLESQGKAVPSGE